MKKSIILILSTVAFFCDLAIGDDQPKPAHGSENAIIVPEIIPDPLEPVNRRIWGLNTSTNKFLIHPVGKGYRYIVCKPVREKISNFSDNLVFPKRFINKLLQGRWNGARQELHRFVVNTTIGGVGLFDPATTFNIPKSEADFGQTFGRWGWDPSMYVVIPVLGPSNERDSIGLMGDAAAHPAIWMTAPYLYGAYGFIFNDIVDKTGEFKRLTEAGADSYFYARLTSAVIRDNDVSEFRITEMPKEAPMNSLNAIFFTNRNAAFPEQAKTRSTVIPSTGKKLKYSLWLQDGQKGSQTALVYILPGLGGNRMDPPSLALAELVFSRGYSVVNLSSVYNTEFMESASTSALPGHATVDNRDLHVALDAIDVDLKSKYGTRLGKRALLGFSMGGFQAMMIAARCESESSPLIQFDRYIAINPPVDLVSGLESLDNLYKLALKWPANERSERIEQAFRKMGSLISASEAKARGAEAAALPVLPFDRTESGFLIGYSYRILLRDIIFSSQSRENLGVLQNPISKFRRAAVYEEIDRYGFSDYLNSFILPYYKNGGGGKKMARNEVAHAANLKNLTSSLRQVNDLRIISSDNDFLLNKGDIPWMKSLVPDNRIKIFHGADHMGQLPTETGQHAVAESIKDL